MPQRVQTNTSQPSTGSNAGERSQRISGVCRGPNRRGEHQVGMFLPRHPRNRCKPFSGLRCLMPSKSLNIARGELRSVKVGRNRRIPASVHEEPDGRYEWCHTVPVSVPTLPGYVASRLPDAEDAAEAATDEEVEAFLAEHSNHQRPDLLAVHISAWQKKTAAGESRHGSVMGHISGAMKEAKAGLIDAKLAADTFEATFVPAIMQQPNGAKQGKARNHDEAENEWAGILAWAVAQGKASDPAKTRERVNEKVPPPFTDAPSGSETSQDQQTGANNKTGGRPSAASQLVELALERYQFG